MASGESEVNESEANKANSEGPEFPNEFLEAIPAEDRGRVIRTLQMMITSRGQSNPLADKITSEHITQLFGLGDKQDERRQEDKQRDRYFNAFIIIVILFFVGGLVYFLKDDQVLLEKIITLILGFGSGFGVGKLTNKEKKEE